MLSMISLQILVRNWQVKHENHRKHLKHNNVNVIMDSKPLLINELKDAFFSLKINKSSGVDDISFIKKLIINNYEIQREESIKFLRVLLDQHLTWKEYIKLTENKINKNIGILYKVRPYLDKRALLCLY